MTKTRLTAAGAVRQARTGLAARLSAGAEKLDVMPKARPRPRLQFP